LALSSGQDRDESLKAREIIRILEKDGWSLDRQKGSHMQFRHPEKPGTVTVSFHGSKDLSKFDISSIRKQAGLK